MYTYICTHEHVHMYVILSVPAIDWCLSDPCQRDMGGLCFLLDGGRTYKCQCKAGFNKITNGDSFMRCQGQSVISVILLYLQSPNSIVKVVECSEMFHSMQYSQNSGALSTKVILYYCVAEMSSSSDL